MKPTTVILRPFVLIGAGLVTCAICSNSNKKVQEPPSNVVLKTIAVEDQGQAESEPLEQNSEVAETNSDTESTTKIKPQHRPNILGRIMKAINPAELASDERVALEQIVVFLKQYGPFSYASVEPFIKGVRNDNVAIKAEIEKIKLEMKQNGKSDNTLSTNDYKEIAQQRIEKRVLEGLITGLIKLGVDPSTANNKDTVTGGENVTDSELVQFEKNMIILESFSKRAAPAGERIIFSGGYYVSSAEHTLEGKITVPPEGKLVGAEE